MSARVALVLPAATLALALAPAAQPASAHRTAPAAPAAPRAETPRPESAPPGLAALARRMEGLALLSERFSLRTSVDLAGQHLPPAVHRGVELLADEVVSGEAAGSPPRAEYTWTTGGHHLRVRVAAGRTYVYVGGLAGRDGGRPWIDVGNQGPGAIFAGQLVQPEAGPTPGSLPVSFTGLARALASAPEATALGAAKIDGEQVSGFRVTVPASGLEGSAAPAPAASGTTGGAYTGPVAVEAFIAADGLPVRTREAFSVGHVAFSALIDLYAVNFPLSVAPPPAARTIGLAAALRQLRRDHALI